MPEDGQVHRYVSIVPDPRSVSPAIGMSRVDAADGAVREDLRHGSTLMSPFPMDRAEFLRLVGVGAGAAVLGSCLQGCKKEQQATPKLSVDFTLDLSQSSNSALAAAGGSLVTQGVIVAHTLGGSYIAVAAACTHAGVTVGYVANAHQFHCNGHGANFNESGGVVNGPASNQLQQMNTSLTGHALRVWS